MLNLDAFTETALTVDGETTIQALHAERDRGVHLAIDDFGTGYSSLARLRSAPVSRLKIDRSFISEVEHDGSDVPIVQATMALARGLGLGIVAEGVETPQQLAYLRRHGCPEVQGISAVAPAPASPFGLAGAHWGGDNPRDGRRRPSRPGRCPPPFSVERGRDGMQRRPLREHLADAGFVSGR